MSIIRQIAVALCHDTGRTTDEIAKQTNVPRQQVRNALARLSREGVAHSVRSSGKIFHWFSGEGPKDPAPHAVARPDRINKMEGKYDCPELRYVPFRNGAMDAFKLPSRGF